MLLHELWELILAWSDENAVTLLVLRTCNMSIHDLVAKNIKVPYCIIDDVSWRIMKSCDIETFAWHCNYFQRVGHVCAIQMYASSDLSVFQTVKHLLDLEHIFSMAIAWRNRPLIECIYNNSSDKTQFKSRYYIIQANGVYNKETRKFIRCNLNLK